MILVEPDKDRKACRGDAESAVELAKILTRQNEMLLAEISRLQEVADMIEKAISEIQAGGDIGIDKLAAITTLMRQGKPLFLSQKTIRSMRLFVKQTA